MQQTIVKSFLQFVNENEEPQIDLQPFLTQLVQLIVDSEKFHNVVLEGNVIKIERNENIHDWADVEDSSGDHIRIYGDYTAKVMPIISDTIEMDPTELNPLLQHGLADITQFVKGFAISTELNCWSEDLEGWSMDDGSDEMEEHSLEDLNIPEGSSIDTIAEELTESIDDWFNQFYTAEDVIQDSVNDFLGENDYDDEDDDSEESQED